MLGLKRGAVTLLPHNPEWLEEFEREKKNILYIIGEKIIDIEHIGSTAIPNIKAKPILDLMIGIKSLDEWAALQPHLETLKYEFRKDLREEQGHILFVKGPENNRTHYLKVTEFGSPFWNKQLLFRDYLLNNPTYAKEYQDLKERLLKRSENDRGTYTSGKTEFIEKILKLAEK